MFNPRQCIVILFLCVYTTNAYRGWSSGVDEYIKIGKSYIDFERPHKYESDVRKLRQIDSTSNPSSAEVITNCIDNCPVTSEYNPVCGTDGVQYTNPGKLSCAVRCTRIDIKIKHYGSCDPSVRTT